jgi:hypothetical protein
MDESKRAEVVETMPLPTGGGARDRLLTLVRTAISLSHVKEIVIDGAGVTLTRYVADGPAWPVEATMTTVEGDTDLVDHAFMMRRISLAELPADKCSFPPEALQASAELLGNRLVGFLFPAGEAGPAYFGIEGQPSAIFGYPVLYGTEAGTKIVIVGGPSHFWSEAREGIVIDIEVGL